MLVTGIHWNDTFGVGHPWEPSYYVSKQAPQRPQTGHEVRPSSQEDGPIEGPWQRQASSPDDEQIALVTDRRAAAAKRNLKRRGTASSPKLLLVI